MDFKPYPTYKDSGVPWLGEVPAHWEMERGKWLFRKMNRPIRDADEVVTCFRDRVAGAPGVAALVAPLSLRTASILGDGHGWYGFRPA